MCKILTELCRLTAFVLLIITLYYLLCLTGYYEPFMAGEQEFLR